MSERNTIMKNLNFTVEPFITNKAPYRIMPKTYDRYWNSFLPVFFDRISTIMRKAMNDAVAEHGISSAHAVYLIALNLQDGQTMSNLSRFLDMNPSNTNRVIKTLKEKEMVYDDRETPTSKKYHIFLTDLGRAISEKAMEMVNEQFENSVSDVTPEELLQVRTTLIKMLRSMDPELDKYMGSVWANPFYTYLHLIPPEDDDSFAKVEPMIYVSPKKHQKSS